MTIAEVYRCARSLEAIENYARADVSALPGPVPAPPRTREIDVYDDISFWGKILQKPEKYWGILVTLSRFALSEWIPRVPGLFWAKGSKALRDQAQHAVEYQSKLWVTFRPLGKSQIVMGGVGTLKFPPNEQGYRLICLSAGSNASSGIPALVSPEVWEHFRLREGEYLRRVEALWQPMSLGWAEQFDSVAGIPRGYLVISNPAQVELLGRQSPTQFHPFTVMEYSAGEARLFDFVYATADTRVASYRRKLERFFDSYKEKHERYGRYLLSADVANPLWEAEYASPAALRHAGPGARSQLEILTHRVREQSFQSQNIDSILRLLAENCTNETLLRYSDQIEIPRNHWYTGAKAPDSAVQFLNICLQRDKVELLLDAFGRDYPNLIITGG